MELDSRKIQKAVTWAPRACGEHELDRVAQLRNMSLEEARGSTRRSGTPAYYHWKIFENPLGHGWLNVAAEGSEIVGTTSMTRKPLRIDGKPVQGAEIGDTFTHPAFQRQGIFSALVNLTREEALGAGVEFVYGTPNENSLPGYERKLSFSQVPAAEVVQWVRPLRSIRVGKVLGGGGRLAAILGGCAGGAWSLYASLRLIRPLRFGGVVESVDRFPSDVAQVVEGAARRYAWMVDRDLAYLEWRFLRNPDRYVIFVARTLSGRTEGYLVQREGEWRGLRVGYLADFLVDEADPGSFGSLLEASLRRCRETGCDLVSAWAPRGGVYGALLKRAAFYPYKSVPVITYRNALGSLMVSRREKWHFTMADSDNI